MKVRRAALLYITFLLFFFLIVCRLYLLATDKTFAARAHNQTVTTLQLETNRGDFYDAAGEKLTGNEPIWYALCIPGEESYARLFHCVDYETQNLLYQRRNSAVPFLVPVERDLGAEGIYTYLGTRRYARQAICAHLLGYLNAAGEGVTGLEAAFEEDLTQPEPPDHLQCVTNAQGKLMDETEPVLLSQQTEECGVQLTISKPIQRACEGIASAMMTSGCILVLETDSAKVRASVSCPFYHPGRVAKSIAANDGSLVDRVFRAYSVGSVFKPVLAAAALEEGLGAFTIECKGYVDRSGQIYRCAGGIAHGSVTLQTALEKSCNCYFIELGDRLGAERLWDYADRFGFGQPVYLARGMRSATGNLPDIKTLQNSGQRANFSFGQGELLAAPLQLAAMMNVIASGGLYRTPAFLERTVQADPFTGELTTKEQLYEPLQQRIIGERSASALQHMLQQVVLQGTGSAAQPIHGDAAGKTGTAQTGRFDEAGSEYQDLWFVGFYPAQQPRYTIVVMQDAQLQAEHSSAAIFSSVCDALYWLEQPAEA